jgi:hypothetical protein
VLGFIQLHDVDNRIPFALSRSDRLLTGADFDIESVRRTRNGDLWFREEFGPFILHTDANGKVLEAPSSLPGVMFRSRAIRLLQRCRPAAASKGCTWREREDALSDDRGSVDRRS